MNLLTPEELRVAAFSAFNTYHKEKKDLGSFSLAARAIIQAALSLADQDEENAGVFRLIALNNSYNLSAACWPCWEDAHQNIADDLLDLGLAAAEFNVDLAKKLDVGPERKKNGRWILGVHRLIRKDFAGARDLFTESAGFAQEAGDRDATKMAEGWCLLTDLLGGDETAKTKLDQLKTDLAALGEDGEFYSGQYDPVIDYFAK
jgi:hypothetical protein|tara:strand:+ start:160 stop:771 length:612 start_codon:yes stop_codon:yes gene_type:complete